MGRRRAHRRGGRSRYIMSTPPSLATQPVATQPRAGLGERGIQLARFRDLALVPAILLLAVVGTLVDPVFLSASNIIDVLQQQTELSLLVLAESLILISGKFDLSLESTIGIAPALAVALVISRENGGLGTNWPTWLAIPLCLLIGLLIGAFNGLMILRFQLSAFIVTLAMLIVLRGLQTGATTGKSLSALAGLLLTGRLGSVAAAQGQGLIFQVFAAAVIGGVSLEGGKGTIFGALCGVIVLGLITNILTLAHVSGYWIQAIYGAIILVALVLARLTTGKAQD